GLQDEDLPGRRRRHKAAEKGNRFERAAYGEHRTRNAWSRGATDTCLGYLSLPAWSLPDERLEKCVERRLASLTKESSTNRRGTRRVPSSIAEARPWIASSGSA